jgi:hypothetical protein
MATQRECGDRNSGDIDGSGTARSSAERRDTRQCEKLCTSIDEVSCEPQPLANHTSRYQRSRRPPHQHARAQPHRDRHQQHHRRHDRRTSTTEHSDQPSGEGSTAARPTGPATSREGNGTIKQEPSAAPRTSSFPVCKMSLAVSASSFCRSRFPSLARSKTHARSGAAADVGQTFERCRDNISAPADPCSCRRRSQWMHSGRKLCSGLPGRVAERAWYRPLGGSLHTRWRHRTRRDHAAGSASFLAR